MRFCIKQNSIDFGGGEACVYRDCRNAEPAASVNQLDVLRRIRQQKREAVARRKTVGCERRRNVLDSLLECLKRNNITSSNERRALLVVPSPSPERMYVDHFLPPNHD